MKVGYDWRDSRCRPTAEERDANEVRKFGGVMIIIDD
jgi:hypothetical protein